MEGKQVAALAKLAFDPQEEAALAAEFQRILHFVRMMEGLDTAGVETTAGVVHPVGALRADAALPSMDRAALLKNAPEQHRGYISVPKAID